MNEDIKKASAEELVNEYQKHFDKNMAFRLLKKLRKKTRDKHIIVSKSTEAIVSSLGTLLSALDNPNLPTKYKALIIGAIGYVILPIDLIPDIIPGVGYADDVASVAGVVMVVAVYSNFSMDALDAEIDAEG